MNDNLTKQITTMIEIITAQSSATPIEKSVIGLLSDCRHEVDLANAEIERLREALRVIADGDAPREHAIIYRSDGVHSKHDKCKHGAWMYDGCEDCVTEYARAALGEGE